VRLSSFHIDGFGALADLGEDELASGLVVVLGPNEAGKSTLFDFLSGVLFGFPKRKDSARFHAPVRGGRHGGRLSFVDEAGGHWVVERHAKPQRGLVVRLPDGSEGDERSLSRALAGASASLFEAVFAVGLDDLGHMKNLESDEVRELLFAASIFGQRRSATKAMKHLGDGRDELARPRREDATANRLAAQLEHVHEELAGARREAGRYEGLRREATAVDNELRTMRVELKALRDHERETELLASCWQHYRRARIAEDGLKTMPPSGDGIRLLEHGAALRELADERSGHFERVEKLAELTRQRDAIELSIESRLGRLGPQWSRQRAAAGPDPEILTASARDARDRLSMLRTGVVSSQAVLAQAESLLEAATAEATSDVVPERVELEQRTAAVAELRERLAEAEHLQLEAVADEQALALGRSDASNHSPAHSVTAILIVCGLAFVALGVALSAMGQPTVGIASAGVGLVLLASSRLGRRGRVQRGRHATRRRTGSPASIDQERVSDRAVSDRASVAERARERIAELARDLDLSLPPSRVDVDRCAATLQRQCDRRRQLDDEAAARRRAEVRVARTADVVVGALQALATEQQAFDDWCTIQGFETTGRPDAALETIAELAAVRERLVDLGRIEKGIAALEPSIASFEHRSHLLFAALGDALGDGARPTFEGPGRELAASAASVEAGLAQLVRDLDVATALETRRGTLQREVSEAESALDSALGGGEASGRLRIRLADGDLLAWASEREELQPVIERLRQTEEDAVRQHQSLAEEMARLATSDRIAELECRQDALEVDLDAALQRYLELGMAKALLQRTLARHERERQPAVVASAATHFARVTNGRYVSLLADPGIDGRRTMRVVSSDGDTIDALSLSRGTIEQLYLCLRLGLADSFAERSVSLPIVLDDVLVNFDPERARAVAGELAESARSHQVVFLTCHPHLAEMVLRAGAEARAESQLVQLGRLGGRDGKWEQLALTALAALPDLPDHRSDGVDDEREEKVAEELPLPTLRPAAGEAPLSS
jgi:uncharacterized protein YhaN